MRLWTSTRGRIKPVALGCVSAVPASGMWGPAGLGTGGTPGQLRCVAACSAPSLAVLTPRHALARRRQDLAAGHQHRCRGGRCAPLLCPLRHLRAPWERGPGAQGLLPHTATGKPESSANSETTKQTDKQTNKHTHKHSAKTRQTLYSPGQSSEPNNPSQGCYAVHQGGPCRGPHESPS